MPSAYVPPPSRSDDPDPGLPGEFAILMDAVQAAVNSVPDRYQQCATNLKQILMNIGAEARPLLADIKAHPQHKAADEQKLAKLAITLGNALATYMKCIHTLPMKLA